MPRKPFLGVIVSYQENWIGGFYYIENLLLALNKVAPSQALEIILFSDSLEALERLKRRGCIFAKWYLIRRGFASKVLLRLKSLLRGLGIFKNLFLEVDVLFPGNNSYLFKDAKVKLHWIPDFQDRFRPEFFSVEELNQRKKWHDDLAEGPAPILFSSHTALKHFRDLYPNSLVATYVVSFASSVTKPSVVESNEVIKSLELPTQFLICSNQFWRHKNHVNLFKALALARKIVPEIVCVFTGQENDYRSPGYFEELTNLATELGLTGALRFLGLVDRSVQLSLLVASRGCVQASLFEGWSTIVEECKALNVNIALSDMDVHREQLPGHDAFFDPHDIQEIADRIVQLWRGDIGQVKTDYSLAVEKFGTDFLEVIKAEFESGPSA